MRAPDYQTLFKRTAESLLRAREERQRAQEWPREVEKLLASLVARVIALETALGIDGGQG